MRTLVRGEVVGTAASAHLFEVTATTYLQPESKTLLDECFGPLAILVRYDNDDELRRALQATTPP